MESAQLNPETVLVKEEEKAVGVVSISVYWSYWSAVGLVLAPFILLALLLMQGTFFVSCCVKVSRPLLYSNNDPLFSVPHHSYIYLVQCVCDPLTPTYT